MNIAQFAVLILKDHFLLQILSPDCTNKVGSIVHAWDSMYSDYRLTVTFPTIEVTTEMKAVILGAAFLLVSNTNINSVRQSVKRSSLNYKQHNELPNNIYIFLNVHFYAMPFNYVSVQSFLANTNTNKSLHWEKNVQKTCG